MALKNRAFNAPKVRVDEEMFKEHMRYELDNKCLKAERQMPKEKKNKCLKNRAAYEYA
jgi:hypothetical protein